MEESLNRIAEQAEFLAREAKSLGTLHRQRKDRGATPVAPEELREATRRMQAAFMAVIRVTAEYL